MPNFTFGKPLSSQKQGYLSSSGYIAAAFQGNLEPMMMIGARKCSRPILNQSSY